MMEVIPYRLPALVAAIAGELGYEALSAGATCDDVFFALYRQPDPCALLLGALTSGDFTTLPKIEVRAVKRRYRERWMEGVVMRNTDGVLLFTDEAVADGDRVLMLLAPATIDAKSALRHCLLSDPTTTKQAAIAAVKEICPRLSQRAFDRDWPQARLDVGLAERGAPGRPRKSPTRFS